MSSLDRLQQHFSKFPGIGPRQAQRFAYFLLHKDRKYIEELVRDIHEARESITTCEKCFKFFAKDANPHPLCDICRNPARDTNQLMVVGRDADLQSIESSHVFSGMYFILGGTLSFFKKHPEKLRTAQLKKRIKDSGIKEVIIAMNANPEGEHTAEFLKKELSDLDVSVFTLGRGLSTGIELEYSDEETLKSALENKRKI